MKKLLFILSAFLIVFIPSTRAQNTTLEIGATINYASLDWFKKGNTFFFTTRDETGQVLDQNKKKIIYVKIQDESTTSLIEFSSKTKFTFTWIGTSEKLWMDFGTEITRIVKNNIPDLKFSPKNEVPNKDNGMYSIPLYLAVGLQLGDANFQLLGTLDDKEVKILTTLTQRKIVGREELKTSAGKFDCFKISSLSTTTIDTNGKIKNLMKPTLEYFWFDVHSGLIKQESHNLRDKLITISYLTEIKK
ncbi:MAG: hypothetical protein ABI208_07190 [Ginsengibacter sp.]|jgi:hypothetical protein